MDCGSTKCPYNDQCINQIFARPKTKESSDKMNEEFPPPPPPQVDGNWELQFCKWWGWTWVRKDNQNETLPASVSRAAPSSKSVSIVAPEDSENAERAPPRPEKKKKKSNGCYCCRRKKKKLPPSTSKSVEKQEVGFNTSNVSVKKSEYGDEGECCLCCPCMQQQFMGCPCMQQQNFQNQFSNQQNVQEVPLASKQVQCSQHCCSVDTQTQQKLQQMGCTCVLQRQRQQQQQQFSCCPCQQQQFSCCPCQQNRVVSNNKQITNADTQTCRKQQNQSTAISHANIPKAKKYRECKCVRKFMRPNCCPCNIRQMNTCCPCYNIPDCPKNIPPQMVTNWCLTDAPQIPELKALAHGPTQIDKSIDLLIKNNMNIKNLLDTEKFFRTEKTENIFDSNETISFLSNNIDSKDHCKLLTKVCDAILSSNTYNSCNEQNKSSSSSTARLPTILSDKSLYETILKDTKNQYLQKLMERSDKDMHLCNFSNLHLNNSLEKEVEKVEVAAPMRPNISRISFTNPNLARAETIEELITAMDLSFNNNVLENFETPTINK